MLVASSMRPDRSTSALLKMPIDMNCAAAAVDGLEAALVRHRGSAANWEAATEYLYPDSSGPAAAATAGLELRDVVPLPPAFVSQYSSFQYKSYLGLFPEIGRAWLTADTRLFLWSYGEERVLRGSPTADDFYAYDGLDQIIVAVALVRPKSNVFIDDVRYLIAVATPVEVTLLGVAFSGNGTAGELSLIPTNISVATDGVLMLSITSTPDGRIFMAGNDGNLHEFVYYGQSTGWASTLLGQRAPKRPRKLVHTRASIINYVVPPAIKDYFAPSDGLLDMTVDPVRNALYTLSGSGRLSVYDIADDQAARLVRTIDISSHSKSVLSYSLPAAEREYSCIFAVPPDLSSQVHLVVVTTFGERIYFSSSADGPDVADMQPPSSGMPESRQGRGSKRPAPEMRLRRPTLLKCVGYRGTPVRDVGAPAERPCVHMAAWAAGSIVMCDLRSGLDDRLFSVFPDPAAGRVGVGGASDGLGVGGGSLGAGGGAAASPAVGGLGVGSGGSGALRALLPSPGQTRPAESVHHVSLGVSQGGGGNVSRGLVGGPDGDYGGAFGGSGGSVAGTPMRGAGGSNHGNTSQSVHAYAIAAVSNESKDSAVVAHRTITPLLEPASMFWVLTPSAMRLYARVQPRQRLASILAAATGGADERNLESFFSHHGVVEASSICIELAISEPSMASASARALYTHGGRSLARRDRSSGWHGNHGEDGGIDGNGDGGLAGTPGRLSLFGMRRMQKSSVTGSRHASPGFDLGRPTQRPVTPASFSGVHDGICVALAKALRPIWHELICTSRDPDAYQQMVFSASLLDEKRETVCSLISFLERFDPDSMLPFDDEDAGGRETRDGGLSQSGAVRYGRCGSTIGDGGQGTLGGTSNGAGGQIPGSMFGVLHTPIAGSSEGRGNQDRTRGQPGFSRGRKSSEARRAEVGAIHNLKQLAIRCSEALAFLSIVCDHQLHRVVPALQSSMRAELVHMQFCDLVARSPGTTVSAALIEVLFASFAAGGSDLGPLSKLLQNRCPSYFDDDDMTLQKGMQLIRAASDLLGIHQDGDAPGSSSEERRFGTAVPIDAAPGDRDAAIKLAEDAVQMLKPLAGRIYNTEAVCEQITRVGAVPAAVELALAIGDGADRVSDNDRAKAAYSCIVDMLAGLLEDCAAADADGALTASVRNAGNDASPLSPEPGALGSGRAGRSRPALEVERRKDAAIRVALSSTSDSFHDNLYAFFMRTKVGERELLARPSPRIENFLQSQGRKDLLWKYYAQHGRHADAASVLVAMAEEEDESSSLVDRLGYLSRALHNAKTSVSSGDDRASALEADIKDYMDVARVQLRLREELARCHSPSKETAAAQERLDCKVLDLTDLYNEFALPFDLLESTLDVLRCGSYRDDRHVRELWIRIVDKEILNTQVPALLEQRIVALGREFYPSDNVFPTRFIVDLLERRSFERKDDASWSTGASGWVSNAMVTIGVPLGEIVDSYRAMIESNPYQSGALQTWSWSDEASQLHAIRGAESALSHWAERAVSGSGRYDVERRMLIAESEKALRTVALCKSRLRGMSSTPTAQALLDRFDAIEGNISTPY